MSAPHVAVATEDWTELDALVEAEFDRMKSHNVKPVAEPEAEEAAFLVEATGFLTRHSDPQRLIAEIVARFPGPDSTTADPQAPDEPEDAHDEPA